MLFVNLLCVALAIKVLEVLVRAPDDVGEFQIFQYGRHEADRLTVQRVPCENWDRNR